jgi:hypothetical protein
MLSLNDIETIEGETTCTMLEYAQAMQRAINSGMAWKMQGSYGRAAMEALESGACMLGREAQRDYWGNVIPGRDDVKPGSKGSKALVVKTNGRAWAKKLEAI